MKQGTKSLLFGVHQFIWHPITVWRAWKFLYGQRPDFWETIAIIVHDWGYWGKSDMDGEEGIDHPELGARIMRWLRPGDPYLYDLVRYHSQTFSRLHHEVPSKLCWPDKASIRFDPAWFYLFRARLSGELREYRKNAVVSGDVLAIETDKSWYYWLRKKNLERSLKHTRRWTTYQT